MVQATSISPVFENGNGEAPNCPKCTKPVFMAEARAAGKYKWHATCFTCRK